MSARKSQSKPQSYAKAVEELEAILGDLEGENIEVDELAAKVKRASGLIQFCRERLNGTRLEIEQVVAELENFEDREADEEIEDEDDLQEDEGTKEGR